MKLRIILNVENLYNEYKWKEHKGHLQNIDSKPSSFIIFLLELLKEYEVVIYHSKSHSFYYRHKMYNWFKEELYAFLRDLNHTTTIMGRVEILEHLNYKSKWILSEESEVWVKDTLKDIKWSWFEPNIDGCNVLGWLDIKDLYSKYPTMNDLFMKTSYDYAIRSKFSVSMLNGVGYNRYRLRDLLKLNRATDIN